MNERLKELRKTLDLTQQKFADKLHMKRNTIANYEIGRNQPIDAVVALICTTFNVNEAWLRTGEGDMFIERSPEEETGYFVEDLLEYSGEGNPFYDMIIEMMIDYRKLDDVSKLAVQKYFKAVSDGLKKKGEA